MWMKLYIRMSPLLAAFLLLTTIVFFSMCVWRGEIILGLQTEANKSKDQQIKVIIEQRDIADKVSLDYEVDKANTQQEKIYVDREIEKIVLMPSYSNVCFDDIGLQHYNSTVRSLNDSRKSTGTVSSDAGAN